jgi:hypothetical protein
MHRRDSLRVISKTPLYRLPELREDLRQFSKTPLHVVNLDEGQLLHLRKVTKVKTIKDKYLSKVADKHRNGSYRIPSLPSPGTSREVQFCFDQLPVRVCDSTSVSPNVSCNNFQKVNLRNKKMYYKSRTTVYEAHPNTFKLEPIQKKLYTVRCKKYHETIRDQMFMSNIEDKGVQTSTHQLKTQSSSLHRSERFRKTKPFTNDFMQAHEPVVCESEDLKEDKWISLSRWDS